MTTQTASRKDALRHAQNVYGCFSIQGQRLLAKLNSQSHRLVEMLMLSSSGNSHGLLYPFHKHAARLRQELGLVFREVQSNSLREKRKSLENFRGKVILIAPPQGETREDIQQFFADIPRKNGQRIILFDVSDSPTAKHFEIAPHVDMYAMSFTYRDRQDYLRNYVVGNRFADFASRYYSLAPVEENEYWPGVFDSKPTADALDKLHTIHRIGCRRRKHKLFSSQGQRCMLEGERTLDVHCRFHPYSGWVRAHRMHARDILRELDGQYRIIATDQKVAAAEYYAELQNSKILFSPFGWGEFCPKDWEAFLKGCLLLKPSVEHVQSWPNTHVPYETYVPVEWDLSDLQEKIHYYLQNHEERRRITLNAARVVENLYEGTSFITMVKGTLEKLGALHNRSSRNDSLS